MLLVSREITGHLIAGNLGGICGKVGFREPCRSEFVPCFVQKSCGNNRIAAFAHIRFKLLDNIAVGAGTFGKEYSGRLGIKHGCGLNRHSQHTETHLKVILAAGVKRNIGGYAHGLADALHHLIYLGKLKSHGCHKGILYKVAPLEMHEFFGAGKSSKIRLLNISVHGPALVSIKPTAAVATGPRILHVAHQTVA